ncbi:MAG: ABC transporter ATP-binding protein [Anaerolineae bacterium]|nr:ABC transporter ATP-binding protein [Anaerolineae bacterium]
MNENHYVLRTEDLRKDLQVGEITVHALRGVSLKVERGEFLGIIGPSGSGKSTLLGLIGGLDVPTNGTVYIDGVDITHLNERALTRIRNEKIGFVFQSFNLIPTLTALENVALPIQFSGHRKQSPQKRAKEILDVLGLGDRFHHRPTQLSGGEQQRVAIARALANEPPLLLADEPTGNLDTASSEVVMEALRNVQTTMNTTIIVVTHDMSVAAELDRLVTLVDGRITQDEPRSSAQMAAVQLLKDKRATGEMPALRLEEIGSSATKTEKMLDEARELLLQKRYDEARTILEILVNNPTAQKWLAQIEQVAPKVQ